jgi:predicted dehydrogenase
LGLKSVDDAELYAVASRNIDNAKKYAQEFNVKKAYGSYEELVKDPNVDIVYVATPHNTHYENTMLCLDNGKHVLCEKPLGVNGKEVREMIAKAKEKNLFLMEAMWSRFLPHIIKTKELIDTGELGNLKLLTAHFSFISVNGPEHRHFNKELCGGSLMDIGIYNAFLSLFLLGKPQSLKAMASIGETDVDDTCAVLCKYDNEIMSVLYSSFRTDNGIAAEVYGEKAKIVIEEPWYKPSSIKIVRTQGEVVPIKLQTEGNGYNYEAEEAVKCIREGRTQSNLMSWEKSLELIDMLDSIRKEACIIYPKHDF